VGVYALETGECAGKDVSGSEESMMVGELWPSGAVTKDVMMAADNVFRIVP
jgi:hypothetical protein